MNGHQSEPVLPVLSERITDSEQRRLAFLLGSYNEAQQIMQRRVWAEQAIAVYEEYVRELMDRYGMNPGDNITDGVIQRSAR